MNTTVTDTKPWYKQFWPWFVFAIPGSAVVMGISLLYVATQNEVSMVKEEWYKDGMAINQRIDKQVKAKELGIAAHIVLSRETGAITVRIPQLDAKLPEAVNLTLVHPTSETKDQQLNMVLTPDKSYWTKISPDKKGFYYLQLSDSTDTWQLDGAINFNNQNVDLTLTAE
ncbi:MAG: FixH family protein [Pseudomonadales bacterium]|nr:FixH family protein [Pseudomonadales bacterium]